MSLDQNNASAIAPDDRVRKVSAIRKALIKPELGAICGALLVFLFFAILAPDSGMFSLEGAVNWGTVSAQFAIIAVGACFLMIAGKFDLSVGSDRHRAPDDGFSVSALGVNHGGIRRRCRDRRPQRPSHCSDGPAVLHRYSRRAVYPARPDDLHSDHDERLDNCQRTETRCAA
jgi:hypothetical protein